MRARAGRKVCRYRLSGRAVSPRKASGSCRSLGNITATSPQTPLAYHTKRMNPKSSFLTDISTYSAESTFNGLSRSHPRTEKQTPPKKKLSRRDHAWNSQIPNLPPCRPALYLHLHLRSQHLPGHAGPEQIRVSLSPPLPAPTLPDSCLPIP